MNLYRGKKSHPPPVALWLRDWTGASCFYPLDKFKIILYCKGITPKLNRKGAFDMSDTEMVLRKEVKNLKAQNAALLEELFELRELAEDLARQSRLVGV